jgi:hypothetical protein
MLRSRALLERAWARIEDSYVADLMGRAVRAWAQKVSDAGTNSPARLAGPLIKEGGYEALASH